MKTLLRIDASVRLHGSHSRSLADYYEARWLHTHPGGRIIRRDLARESIPHLDQTTLDALYDANASGLAAPATKLSDSLIAELLSADAIVIATPLYNAGPPSSLKAYFDHIVRSGRTFTMDAHGQATGLVVGKTATVITARGGPASPDGASDHSDFQTPYLDAILRFIGFTDITQILLANTANPGAGREENLARAHADIETLFDKTRPVDGEPEWIGPFTPDDRKAISALRAHQASAVATGDIARYASLVTDDIRWMFPGRDVVTGRTRFSEAQHSLRNGPVKILSMRKTPLRVERAGDLAIEIGRQELVVESGASAYPPRQKYLHVFRKTVEGWRFAVLMSNSSC